MAYLELPGVWLDALVEDTGAPDIDLINLTPEPDQTGVENDALISLDMPLWTRYRRHQPHPGLRPDRRWA